MMREEDEESRWVMREEERWGKSRGANWEGKRKGLNYNIGLEIHRILEFRGFD